MPDKPVPIVRALGLAAVMVPEAPSATATPLNVTELLVSALFGIAERVFADPLIDLLVSVWVAVLVVTVSAPTVAATMLNVPSVTVLPVNVKAAGKDKVTFVVPVAVISFAVPATDATAPMPEAVIVTLLAEVSWPCALTAN